MKGIPHDLWSNVATGLPDISKASGTSQNLRKPKFRDLNVETRIFLFLRAFKTTSTVCVHCFFSGGKGRGPPLQEKLAVYTDCAGRFEGPKKKNKRVFKAYI